MCQAVWQSPLLPLISTVPDTPSVASAPFGTGERFKRDLLAYLEAYGHNKTGPLAKQLKRHDFSTVRAALIASVPSKQRLSNTDSKKATLWGWPALRDTLRQIPLDQMKGDRDRSHAPHIIIQVRKPTPTSFLYSFVTSASRRTLMKRARSHQLPPWVRLTNG